MTSLKALMILALSLLFLVPDAATGTRRDERGSQPDLDRYFRNYEVFRLDPDSAVAGVRDTGELSIEISGQKFDLVLTPHDIRSPRYFAEETLDWGRRLAIGPDRLDTYRGVVDGVPETEARFTLKEGRVEGVIFTPEEWYYLEPLQNYDRQAHRSEMLLYRRSEIRPEALGSCGTTLAEKLGKAQDLLVPMERMGVAGTSVVEIATEADHEYVLALGGSGEANTEILGILNQVEGVYQSELSISFQVVYQHAWVTPDDPYHSTSASSMLGEFRSHWNSSFFGIGYDLAHMWTGKSLDGSTVGIAYLSVVCNARTYSYGVSKRFTSSPGKFILTAHEIGHNFGASHPDQANPAPGECSNSIMHSFVTTGFSFCQFSRSEISGHLARYPVCLQQGPAAPSNLTAQAPSATQITLAWQDNSTDETGFRIERKTSPAASWVPIASTGANVTLYADFGLTSGTTYTYRVQAAGSAASSAWSNEASATTPGNLPSVTGMLPSSGSIGAQVTITGTGLSGATSVHFNGTSAGSFTVLSPTQITAVVPAGASTGRVRVTTPGGTAQSSFDFVVTSCDVNGDGTLNASDVQVLVNVILGAASCPGNCDLNRDGRVDVLDLQILLNILLGAASCP